MTITSVVMVAGVCNSVGVFFLTCQRDAGGGGEYGLVSRPRLLIGNGWMSQLPDR